MNPNGELYPVVIPSGLFTEVAPGVLIYQDTGQNLKLMVRRWDAPGPVLRPEVHGPTNIGVSRPELETEGETQ